MTPVYGWRDAGDTGSLGWGGRLLRSRTGGNESGGRHFGGRRPGLFEAVTALIENASAADAARVIVALIERASVSGASVSTEKPGG